MCASTEKLHMRSVTKFHCVILLAFYIVHLAMHSTRNTVHSRDTLLAVDKTVKQYPELCRLPKCVFCVIRKLNICTVRPTRRGKRGGRKCKKLNDRGRTLKHPNQLTVCSLNCQSVKGKCISGIISDLVIQYDMDIFAMTETWLTSNETDDIYLKALTLPGYELYSIPRTGPTEGHGGVAVLYRKTLKPLSMETRIIKSFEYCEVVFASGSLCFTLCAVYRPSPSQVNKCTLAGFFKDFPSFLQDYTTARGGFILVGDLNFHLDDAEDYWAKRFMNVITPLNFKQLVYGPTHRHGHTLDVVITRETDTLMW